MEEIRLTTRDVWNPVNHGINYQPQLVNRILSINSIPSLSQTLSSPGTWYDGIIDFSTTLKSYFYHFVSKKYEAFETNQPTTEGRIGSAGVESGWPKRPDWAAEARKSTLKKQFKKEKEKTLRPHGRRANQKHLRFVFVNQKGGAFLWIFLHLEFFSCWLEVFVCPFLETPFFFLWK